LFSFYFCGARVWLPRKIGFCPSRQTDFLLSQALPASHFKIGRNFSLEATAETVARNPEFRVNPVTESGR